MRSCTWPGIASGIVLALIALLLPDSLVRASTSCPEPVFIGDYPSSQETGWSEELQGVAHDDQHWFFTQEDRLLKIPVDFDLNTGIDRDSPPPGVLSVPIPPEMAGLGYTHLGDLDHYAGLLFIPVESDDKSAIAVFRASDLSLVTFSEVPQDRAAWVAVNPAQGLLYTSGKNVSSEPYAEGAGPIHRYRFDLEALRRIVGTDLSVSFLTSLDFFDLSTGTDQPVRLYTMQGGVFSPLGDLSLVSSPNLPVDPGGITVWDPSGKLIKRSENGEGAFNFEFHPDALIREEPEGIDWWDRDTGPASPRISGQLHVILLDNDVFSADDIIFKHYQVSYPCIAGADTMPPTTAALFSPVPNAAEWNSGDVSVKLSATDDASGVSQIAYSASGAHVIPTTTVDGPITSFLITAEGVTTITFFAEDNAGNQETPATIIVRIDRTPPTITAPPDVTVGTGPGATVCSAVVADATLGTAAASDNSGFVTTSRSGVPPGNVFPVGVTTVTYTASDVVGQMTSATQTLRVKDTTPPVLPTPPDVTANATSPAGAVVTYLLPAATDNCPGVSVIGAPPSGSTFAIGTTAVTVTVIDAAGNKASKTFQVTVVGAAGQTTNLRALVTSFGLDHGSEDSLLAKLGNALAAINAGNVRAGCGMLGAFINEVQAQSGKKITSAQAMQLIAAANQIRAVLGCS